MIRESDSNSGSEYLDQLEHAEKVPPLVGAGRPARGISVVPLEVSGQLEEAVRAGLAAQAIQERTQLSD